MPIYQYIGGPKDGQITAHDEETLMALFPNGSYVEQGSESTFEMHLAGIERPDDLRYMIWRGSPDQ